MNPTDYQQLAARTECDQMAAKERINRDRQTASGGVAELVPTRLLHASLGLAGEVGELSAAIERWLYYGQPLDRVNIEEEVGDCFWYLALACNALDLDMGEAMQANIAKLRQRYPDKYTDEQAREDSRDRQAERNIISMTPTSDQHIQTGQGWAEPPQGSEGMETI